MLCDTGSRERQDYHHIYIYVYPTYTVPDSAPDVTCKPIAFERSPECSAWVGIIIGR